MKFVGIAGSIAEESYNRKLLTYIASKYQGVADIEILSIADVPMFDRQKDQTQGAAIQYLIHKIEAADGVILATPEHNHTLAPAMKNVIEWLSFTAHPLQDKPVLVVGASYKDQGTSRAQLSLRQILESPGVGALVMPMDEFLLANARTAFDAQGNLKDQNTVQFLTKVMQEFAKWVKVLRAMKHPEADDAWQQEDLTASHPTETTVDVPMEADDWVEQAAAKTNAVDGKTYVKLDRGLLTVDQLNLFLNSMAQELTYMDENDQFIYYNHFLDRDEMLAPRYPHQVGDPMAAVHPDRAKDHVKQVIWALRNRQSDLIKMAVPGNKINEKWIMHYYKAMRDEAGTFRGINEWVLDIWPIVADYLKRTGQALVKVPGAQADTGGSASVKDTGATSDTTDAGASASVKDAETPVNPEPDTGASASVKD
ncbi:NADPH-dependent oxidoreductase [Agrilactobacillus fermenti]|uniref:NADPH-dependent oxidoreductase n=1 Tax=Agrilactobacillus fermenti TaxID=2586909 RepID=UPI002E7AC22D|nr:NADPH-dependent oxidoreductase [Agrilactobacillus fermenti]MCD2255198.1 NADPH-dependent oxidoreductase [Agrilactobacillus fermenti]